LDPGPDPSQIQSGKNNSNSGNSGQKKNNQGSQQSQSANVAFNFKQLQNLQQQTQTQVQNAANAIRNLPAAIAALGSPPDSGYNYALDTFSPETTRRLYELAAALGLLGLYLAVRSRNLKRGKIQPGRSTQDYAPVREQVTTGR